MKTCSKSPLMLLKLIFITGLPVLEALQLNVLPELSAYLGQDVTLPCEFIQGSKNFNITQSQWSVLQQDGEPVIIIVVSSQFGTSTPISPLKGRVEADGQSLIIKGVEMRDAGSYMCTLTTFPLGAFEGTTELVVREQIPLSAGEVSAIVIAVILLVGIIAAVAYLIFIRRCNSSVRHHVFVDTRGTPMDVSRPSVTVRDQDVVYSDVKFKPFRDVTPSSTNERTDTMYADVTYAKVVVGQRPT